MDCNPHDLEYGKATVSYENGACVEVAFHKARASANNGACVEVGNPDGHKGCGLVHVRNSRFPDRVIDVSRGHWNLLVTGSGAIGQVRLADWFPQELYGDFAASFTAAEEMAFGSGVLNGESQLVGTG